MAFFSSLNPARIPRVIDPENELQVLRERILQTFLLIIIPLALIAYVINLGIQIDNKNIPIAVVYTLVVFWIIIIALYRTLPYNLRSGSFLFILFLLGTIELTASGLSGDGRLFLIIFGITSFILFEPRIGLVNLVLAVITLAVIGALMVTGQIEAPPVSIQANSANPTDWLSSSIIFSLLSIITAISIISIVKGLTIKISVQSKHSADLMLERDALEHKVTERAQAYEKRLDQVDVANRVAREILYMTDAHTIFDEAVQLIKERFDFYHAGLFLINESSEYAVLQSATGDAGKRMLENKHRLRIGEEGIVGHVISRGEPKVAQMTSEDLTHFDNPLLPHTRSEMAVPLILKGTAIGALDVQSTIPNAFTSDDVRLMQVLADQLVLAYDKASLLGELQKRIDELTKNQQLSTRKSWQLHLRGRSNIYSYKSDQQAVLHVEDRPNPEALKALEMSVPIIDNISGNGHEPSLAIAVPIRLRNETLGVLNIRSNAATTIQEQMDIASAIADRLAVALESTRLMEEIQLRAERERLISEIASSVRTSTNIEGILRTAAEEMGQKLGLSSVTVQLRPNISSGLDTAQEEE